MTEFKEPRMEQSQETTNAVVNRQVIELEGKVQDLEEQMDALIDERNSALKWGFIVMGSAVVSLVLWIFNSLLGASK